jgi:hypothetical protein
MDRLTLAAIGVVLTCAASACGPAHTESDNRSTPAATAAGETQPVAKPPAAREVVIPAGTALPIVLDSTISSATSRVEQEVRAHLAHAIEVHGITALPAGSAVTGVVTDATRSGRVKGRAHVAVRFHEIAPRGQDERYAIAAGPVARVAPGTKKKDALEIGGPAAGGALVGALVGGKKGALIGTGIGGGAGTAVVLSTRGKDVRLAAGTRLTIHLTAPLTVRVKG